MPLTLIQNDITKMQVDAIVNAANSSLAQGGGVCGAIFRAAGEQEMQTACNAIGHCDVGSAVITPGFQLQAKHVIHAVGPIWRGGLRGEQRLLTSAYTRALELAKEQGLESVAFPLISSGVYGYPKEAALRVAMRVIQSFLQKNEMQVYLVLFDREAVRLGGRLSGKIEKYLSKHYVEEPPMRRFMAEKAYMEAQEAEESVAFLAASAPALQSEEKEQTQERRRSLDEVVSQLEEGFSQSLLRLIDEKGMTDVEVYKRANIDRKLFSKIRSDQAYRPSKNTAIALVIALRLNLDEAKDLLGRAGYGLSPGSVADVIIRFFIEEGRYDIFEINEALFAYEQAVLGA